MDSEKHSRVRRRTSFFAALLPTQRIVHPQRELGVTEVLRLVDVVEEVVEPSAGDRRPAFREPPADRRRQTRREREEILAGQLRMVVEGAPQIQKRNARADGDGPRVPDGEVAPERSAAGQLEEPLRDRRGPWKLERRRATAHREIDCPGQVVAEIVADAQLRPGEHRRGKESVPGRGIEKELPSAGAEHAPARSGSSLLRVVAEGPPREPDRKSTRLNSSHRTIAYAVFCLKKKNDIIAR